VRQGSGSQGLARVGAHPVTLHAPTRYSAPRAWPSPQSPADKEPKHPFDRRTVRVPRPTPSSCEPPDPSRLLSLALESPATKLDVDGHSSFAVFLG
jgi:hypothetical protein